MCILYNNIFILFFFPVPAFMSFKARLRAVVSPIIVFDCAHGIHHGHAMVGERSGHVAVGFFHGHAAGYGWNRDHAAGRVSYHEKDYDCGRDH